MPAPPVFQRAPRIYPELPKGEVEIPPPPPVPAAPSTSLATAMLPRIGAVGGLGATLFGAATGRWEYALPSLGFTVVSSVTAVVNHNSQKGGYKRAVREREEKYRGLLASRSRELSTMRERQQHVLREIDLEPAACLTRVERLERRLWERSPQDPDFLMLRLGIGMQPSAVPVKPP